MNLIYIKSPLEPKSHSVIRSLLKKEQGEKITPYILKISKSSAIIAYLKQEKIKHEIYHNQEEEDSENDCKPKKQFVTENINSTERHKKSRRWEITAISDWVKLLKH